MPISKWFATTGNANLNTITTISQGEPTDPPFISSSALWVDFDNIIATAHKSVDTVRLINKEIHLVEFKDRPVGSLNTKDVIEKYTKSKDYFDKINKPNNYISYLVYSLDKTNKNTNYSKQSKVSSIKTALKSTHNCKVITNDDFKTIYSLYL